MGTDVKVVPATPAHAEALAASMRHADVAEVLALGFPDAHAAVAQSVAAAPIALALLFDGEVAAICGISEMEDGPNGQSIACVWALTGRAVESHKKDFLRASRTLLERFLSHCDILVNWVDARYYASIRWLRWLDFSVGPARPFGPMGVLFHPVSIRREAFSWGH